METAWTCMLTCPKLVYPALMAQSYTTQTQLLVRSPLRAWSSAMAHRTPRPRPLPPLLPACSLLQHLHLLGRPLHWTRQWMGSRLEPNISSRQPGGPPRPSRSLIPTRMRSPGRITSHQVGRQG